MSATRQIIKETLYNDDAIKVILNYFVRGGDDSYNDYIKYDHNKKEDIAVSYYMDIIFNVIMEFKDYCEDYVKREIPKDKEQRDKYIINLFDNILFIYDNTLYKSILIKLYPEIFCMIFRTFIMEYKTYNIPELVKVLFNHMFKNIYFDDMIPILLANIEEEIKTTDKEQLLYEYFTDKYKGINYNYDNLKNADDVKKLMNDIKNIVSSCDI